MAARKRTRSGRFTAKNSRRRRSKWKGSISIPDAVIGIATASTLTKSLFDYNVGTWLTQGWDGQAEGASWSLTLPELLGVVTNMGVYGATSQQVTGSSTAGGEYVMAAIKKNLREEAPKAIGGLVTLMIANGVLKKVGAYRRLNKITRQVGAGKLVKWS